MLFHIHEPETFTPISGIYTVNTAKFGGALLRHLYIKPTTSSTTYDFSLEDSDGRVFIDLDDNTGCLNKEYQLPLIGIHTIRITNASEDEAFDFRFVVQDSFNG